VRRPFSTLLVANRGEIARRIFRTARFMGMVCIAVYVEADADAPFVAEADESIRLPTSYLDGLAIVSAATAAGAEAVHPGYGFLSENAQFAQSVDDSGLVWVGPPSTVIETMGDKLSAKRAAIAAGLPTLPWSEDPTIDDQVGYPLLVKAAAGGGGKGMRIVQSPEDLREAVAAARREAGNSFGDDRVFLERYIARSRHVEIQILGDGYGGIVHLGERECSIQRRHQKIIEESPSPIIDTERRDVMGQAALRFARAIGYQSAGTVEFLVDDGSREFFFLEVNTRLQVEHPVTEEVTGVDLVREQLRIAAGEALGYGQEAISFSGHAIEARIYAEDPAAGFLPSSGTLAAFEPASEPAVRWDSGVEAGSAIAVEFDPLLAKVVAHDRTRVDAARRLARALERLHVAGVTTNRDFLAATLRHPTFIVGDTTTDFIERASSTASMVLSETELVRAACLGTLWIQGRNRAADSVFACLPAGWRNARLPPQRVSLGYGERTIDLAYASRRDGAVVFDNGPVGRIHQWSPESVDAEIDGRRVNAKVTEADGRLYLQIARGTIAFTIVPRFVAPGSADLVGGLSAPMPGVVIDIYCAVGDRVDKQQPLIVLEAMKMEHLVRAPTAGVVAELRVRTGEHVENGAMLLVLDSVDTGSEKAVDGEMLWWVEAIRIANRRAVYRYWSPRTSKGAIIAVGPCRRTQILQQARRLGAARRPTVRNSGVRAVRGSVSSSGAESRSLSVCSFSVAHGQGRVKSACMEFASSALRCCVQNRRCD
jgi:propionyl-CoA carboxylase alpha chain